MFWRENRFLFNQGPNANGDVELWCEVTDISSVTPRFSVLCVFFIEPITGPRPSWARVNITLTVERKLALSSGGALLNECTCGLLRKAGETNDLIDVNQRQADRAVGYFTNALEAEMSQDYLYINRHKRNPLICTRCGKVCNPCDPKWRR